MSRLNDANIKLAREIIARYPRPKSALIPLLHLSQEQNGYITREAMQHLGELVGVTSAEVYGTASFYEMFKFEPVGKYLINICGTMSCALMGAHELMHHAEKKLGIKAGGTTPDGVFTLAHAAGQLSIPFARNTRRPRPIDRQSAGRKIKRRVSTARCSFKSSPINRCIESGRCQST
jgi:NADH-quinone oxidoreductase subunit E